MSSSLTMFMEWTHSGKSDDENQTSDNIEVITIIFSYYLQAKLTPI